MHARRAVLNSYHCAPALGDDTGSLPEGEGATHSIHTKKPKMAGNTEQDIRFLRDSKSHIQFACEACGMCCGAFTIVLSTYDIFRLRKITGCSTTQLLESEIMSIRRESFRRFFGLAQVTEFLDVFGISTDDTVPIAFLEFRLSDSGRTECHFLEAQIEGKRLCRIYADRPTMCRLHPLGCLTISGRRKWFIRRPLCSAETVQEDTPTRSAQSKRDYGNGCTVRKWISISEAKPFLAANKQFSSWMQALLGPSSRFASLPEGERRTVERILYDFDSLPPEGRITYRRIDQMFRRWQSELAGEQGRRDK